MAHIVLFHHALGLTPGVRALGDRLAQPGHQVTVPDLYDGRVFETLDAGVGHAQEIGFHHVIERGRAAVVDLPGEVVFVGISLGVLPAQALAQTRPGALGALLLESFVPLGEFGDWPAELPAQVHGAESDPIFAGEGDLDFARALVAEQPSTELFLYPGDQHLFTDPGLASYDDAATDLVVERMLGFLAALGAG